MEISFTVPAVNFLFRMLLNPGSLAPDQAYKAADEPAAKDVIGLQRWLRSKEALTHEEEQDSAGGKIKVWVFKAATVKIKQRYIDRLKEMCEHYKNVGRNTHNVEAYQELVACLNGSVFETESVEED